MRTVVAIAFLATVVGCALLLLSLAEPPPVIPHRKTEGLPPPPKAKARAKPVEPPPKFVPKDRPRVQAIPPPRVRARPIQGGYVIESAFPKLRFRRPIGLTVAPGDRHRLYVLEQEGRILAFQNRPSVSATSVFLDIRERVSRAGLEEGLLGLAFDPRFERNGTFFLDYSRSAPRRTVITRFRVRANDSTLGDPRSEELVLEVPQPYPNHNGGCIAFGKDNFLYIGLGDGGGEGDPQDNGQNLLTLLGSILRIDPHRTTDGKPYAIPMDNPFVDTGAREEIWAYGLRNPWRFSFDRESGELWCGDVGAESREEIDIINPGRNYGWRVREGKSAYDIEHRNFDEMLEPPLIEYGHSVAGAIIGGCVYRGRKFPELVGAYIHGDYVTGKVWALVRNRGRLVSNTEIGKVDRLVSFGEDSEGEIYMVSLSGEIMTLARKTKKVEHKTLRLSDTGLFTDMRTMLPASGLVPYEINYEAWTDGAFEERWIKLPEGKAIRFAPDAPWAFPVGTKLIQHIEMRSDVQIQRLETRILTREATGWVPESYRWDTDQSDATIVPRREIGVFSIQSGSSSRTVTWTYPGKKDCMACHNHTAGVVLGVRTEQMNRDVDDLRGQTSARANQLQLWRDAGILAGFTGDPKRLPAYPPHDRSGVSMSKRVRAYLAVNCAMCHLPNGPADVDMDLRFSTREDKMGIFDVPPRRGALGLEDAKIVSSGDRDRSVLLERMRRLDKFHMPPVGSNTTDKKVLRLIGNWIDIRLPK